MNPLHHRRLIRRLAGVLAGVTALLASVTTGPVAFASLRGHPRVPVHLPPPPPGLFKHPPVPMHLPPPPPGFFKHPPVVDPARAHAILAGAISGWQIALVAVGVAVVAVIAVLADRALAARRRQTVASN